MIDRELSVSEIILLGNSAKLTLVTRLHAGIMAHHGGSPVVAVSYQPKVKDVLQESAISNHVFDIEFTNREEVIQQVIDSLDKKHEIQSKISMDKIDKVLIKILGTK